VTLLLTLVLAPVLVVASTLAGRRGGARLTGVLVGLPVVAGPILLIADEQGPDVAYGTPDPRSRVLAVVTP